MSRGHVERPWALLLLHSAPSSLQRHLLWRQERQRGGSSHTPCRGKSAGGKEQWVHSTCACPGRWPCADSLPSLGSSSPTHPLGSLLARLQCPVRGTGVQSSLGRGRAASGRSTDAVRAPSASAPWRGLVPSRRPPSCSLRGACTGLAVLAEGGEYTLLAASLRTRSNQLCALNPHAITGHCGEFTGTPRGDSRPQAPAFTSCARWEWPPSKEKLSF